MNNALIARFATFLEETITDEQFHFSTMVTKYEGNCGTVCCAAGWLPKFDPSKFKWQAPIYKDDHAVLVNAYGPHINNWVLSSDLAEYFDITNQQAKHIFFNASDNGLFYRVRDLYVKKSDVINALRKLIE